MKKFLLALCLALPLSCLAADFSFKDTNGKTQRLSNYKGKWVLVNIWATWCPPCIRELPELINIHRDHKDKDLVVISFAMDSGDKTKVDAFLKKNKFDINFPIIIWNWKQDIKLDEEVTKQFGDIQAVPASFLYAPNGEMVAQQRGGEITRKDLETYIKNKKF